MIQLKMRYSLLIDKDEGERKKERKNIPLHVSLANHPSMQITSTGESTTKRKEGGRMNKQMDR